MAWFLILNYIKRTPNKITADNRLIVQEADRADTPPISLVGVGAGVGEGVGVTRLTSKLATDGSAPIILSAASPSVDESKVEATSAAESPPNNSTTMKDFSVEPAATEVTVASRSA